jgi:hypothetical protein
MRVLGPAVVRVRVLVLDVLVVMGAMRVGVGVATMAVFVHMSLVVAVLFGHIDPSLVD